MQEMDSEVDEGWLESGNNVRGAPEVVVGEEYMEGGEVVDEKVVVEGVVGIVGECNVAL
jgi:hypothetical protein